jgi:hypothetical protein
MRHGLPARPGRWLIRHFAESLEGTLRLVCGNTLSINASSIKRERHHSIKWPWIPIPTGKFGMNASDKMPLS